MDHLVDRPSLLPAPESRQPHTTSPPRRRVSRGVLILHLILHHLLLLLLLLLFLLHFSLSLDIRAPRNSLITVLQPSPRLAARDSRPAGSDPLPRAGNLAAAALTLARADVAVLLHDGGNLLPHAFALGEAVDGPQHVISEIRQEQEGVVVAVGLKGDLLLERETVEDLINQTGDLLGHGAVGADGVAAVDEREE